MEWEPTDDELAGVADLFGGLTRQEFGRALAEVAFKRGDESNPDAFDAHLHRAVKAYALVAVPHDAELLLVPGPVAFPALPDGAEDLPHILDLEPRSVPREAKATRVRERLAAEAERAVEQRDAERAATLLEVTYDAESWVRVDLDDARKTVQSIL